MKHFFTETEKDSGIHILEVEDVVFTGERLEGEARTYRLYGSAVVDGEVYPSFVIEFELAADPADDTMEAVMQAEWDSYDFIFSLED